MSRSATNAAKKVLSKTRGLFVATHWIAGAMSKYDKNANKTFYCSVGGLRYIAAGDPDVDGGSLYETQEYCGAVSALALQIQDDEFVQSMVNVLDDVNAADGERSHALAVLEDVIVEWNDDQDDAESVVEYFDGALARLT